MLALNLFFKNITSVLYVKSVDLGGEGAGGVGGCYLGIGDFIPPAVLKAKLFYMFQGCPYFCTFVSLGMSESSYIL